MSDNMIKNIEECLDTLSKEFSDFKVDFIRLATSLELNDKATHQRLDILNGKVASHEGWIGKREKELAKEEGRKEIEAKKMVFGKEIKLMTLERILWVGATIVVSLILGS